MSLIRGSADQQQKFQQQLTHAIVYSGIREEMDGLSLMLSQMAMERMYARAQLGHAMNPQQALIMSMRDYLQEIENLEKQQAQAPPAAGNDGQPG